MKEIALSKQKRKNSRNLGRVAIVDDEDYDWLNQYNWCLNLSERPGGGYAFRKDPGTGKIVGMHRMVINAPAGVGVDHINGNGLDNRRSNLRLATARQNVANQRLSKRNKSGFKGVHFNKQNGKWKLTICMHFDTAEEAGRMYDWIERMLFGEYARTNFSDGQQVIPYVQKLP